MKQNTLLKVLSLNSISVGISFVLGLFSSKIISVFLGPAGIALMGSFRNFSSMIKLTATLGISNSLVKLIIENKEDDNEISEIYSTFFWIFLMLSLVLGIPIILFSKRISDFLFFTSVYSTAILFFGAFLPFIVINTFWIAFYNAFEKFKKIVVIQIISNVLVFLTTAFLIWKKQIYGGLLSLAIGEILMVFVTFLFIRVDSKLFEFKLQRIIKKKYYKVIRNFSLMALLSAILTPLTSIFIRNLIINLYTVQEAGIWDGVGRLSGFYMTFFSSGLALYYLPKLSSINTDEEFVKELKFYFKTLVPLFLGMGICVFFLKEFIIDIAFTKQFEKIGTILIWQLGGDFLKIMTLAFGYQIMVKTMIKKYFIIEIVFNSFYLFAAYFLINNGRSEGALQAYFIANAISLATILFMFRKQIIQVFKK